MLTYAIRRLLYGVPVIALSSFLIFVFVSTTTDPLETVRLNPRAASKSSVDLVVKEHHLDRRVIVRYGYWVRDVFYEELRDDDPHEPPDPAGHQARPRQHGPARAGG
jgi:ABC-type dipeptide/oligopeptide/nickel transport system permease component